MPRAVQAVEMSTPSRDSKGQSKSKSLPRKLLQLTDQLLDLQELYAQSQLSQSTSRQLNTILKHGQPVTCVVSLGLGSLFVTKARSRRLKQLAILLAIRDYIQTVRREPIEVYAQDPTFTRLDEALLTSLGIGTLRTTSGSELGQAGSIISPTTLVYSPFLTLEAYGQLFFNMAVSVQYLIGDDLDALLQKWPKRSAEWRQVEDMVKSGLTKYKKKAVSGVGYWSQEDETFPMVIYVQKDILVQAVTKL